MRQKRTRAMDALMPRVRQGVLAELLLNPGREWNRSGLAHRLGRPASSLQRELNRLARAGILRERKEANRTYYRANEESPLLPELRGLVAKTAGVVELLREVFIAFESVIDVAFVFGSMARGEERAESDVDLLIVGDIARSSLLGALREAESRLGREVNAKVYTAREFAEKARAGHHFVTGVIAGPKLFVLGTEHGMEAALERGAGAGAHDERD